MKTIACITVLTFSALAAGAASAQTSVPAAPAAAPAHAAHMAKPIVKTTCADYTALDETIKPEFIYYVVGHSKHGRPDAVFDEVAIDKIKPELDQYCSVNLTKSAYEKVMASSMASDPVGRTAHSK